MRSASQLLADFRAARAGIQKLNDDLPRIIGNESVRIVKQNFKLQGYDSGNGITPWKARAAVTDKAYDRRSGVKGSVYNSASPVLMQTKNLYNAVKYAIIGRAVIIGVDLTIVPYGEKMNEGGKGVWGKNATTDTPARKYMPTNSEPPNKKILNAIFKKVKSQRDQALANFKK